MRRSPASSALMLAAAFIAGFFTYWLYLRWSGPLLQSSTSTIERGNDHPQNSVIEPQSHALTYRPSDAFREKAVEELPVIQAREVEQIRGLIGRRARIRGRVFRVGYSAKSNTYFLDFGPARQALTGVIFASAVELFENSKLSPKTFEGKEVEIQGEIKDHPQYGLELILEGPSQIKVIP